MRLISRAERAYILRLAATMGVFIFALLLVKRWTLSDHPPTGVLLYVAAIAPAVPILAAIAAVGRYLVEESDEYQRTLLVRSVLWATGATLAITTVHDFLMDFAHVPPTEPGFVFFIFCISLGVATAAVKLLEQR